MDKVINFLKENYKSMVSAAVRYGLKLSTPLAMVATFLLSKLVELGILTAEKAIDNAQNKKAIEELKKETGKPLSEVDLAELDRLEREILEGK